MDTTVAMSPNLLVRYLRKPASEFTRADIVRFCVENEVECINFHYCGWDGRLKTLNFVILSQEHLENILEGLVCLLQDEFRRTLKGLALTVEIRT